MRLCRATSVASRLGQQIERPQEQVKADASTFFNTGSLSHELKFGADYLIPKPFDSRLILRIAPAMLPHLQDRCVTFRRFPNGVDDKSFFEKRCPSHRPDWVETALDQILAHDWTLLVLHDVDRVCPIVSNIDLATDIIDRPWAKRRLPH